MLCRRCNRIPRPIAPEIRRSAKRKDVILARAARGALVQHGCRKSIGGIRPPISQDRSLPSLEAGVSRAVKAKGASVQSGPVERDLGVDGDFVVVLEVLAHAGEVDYDGNAEALELLARSDAGQFEDLGGVVCSRRDDDFPRGVGSAISTASGGRGEFACAVEMFTLEELDACCLGRGDGLIKEDAGDVGVEANVEWVLLASIWIPGIPHGEDEFAGAGALGVIGGERDLVVGGMAVAELAVGVEITGEECANVDELVGEVAQGKGAACDEGEQLRVLKGDGQGRELSSEPSVEAVALGEARKVLLAFETGKVVTHAGGRPGRVPGEFLHVGKVGLMGVDGHEGVVSGAAAEGASSGVENALDG